MDLLALSKKKIDGGDHMPKWLQFTEEPCLDAFGPGETPAPAPDPRP